jgi:hypothetical protein
MQPKNFVNDSVEIGKSHGKLFPSRITSRKLRQLLAKLLLLLLFSCKFNERPLCGILSKFTLGIRRIHTVRLTTKITLLTSEPQRKMGKAYSMLFRNLNSKY